MLDRRYSCNLCLMPESHGLNPWEWLNNYRYALADSEPERVLYLAIPLNAYNEFFTRPFIQSVIQRGQVSLIIYDVENEEIVRWQT